MTALTAHGLFAPVFLKKGCCYAVSARRSPGHSSLAGKGFPFPEKKRSSEVLKGRMKECGEDKKEPSAELVGIMCCMGQ